MTAATAPALRERLTDHLRVPLHRSGYALVANAAVTSGLGLAYWALAARHYPAAAVGASAALLAALQVVANVAQLGFRNSLIRFVPSAGSRAPALVRTAYTAAGAAAALGAVVFVAVHGRWFPELTLLDQAAGAALFVAAAVVWMVFILQDSVLVAVRRATWVPVENVAYGGLKLVLLVAVVGVLPGWGIFVSWVAPLVLLVVPVSLALFGRFLPELGRRPPAEELTTADLVRFSGGDYTGTLLWHTTIDALPLVVLAVAGAADGAYYALSWTIAYALYLIPSGVGSALVAEAAHEPEHVELHTRRALRQSLLLAVPAALVVAAAAPLLLTVLGAEYRNEATTLLRLLALSAIPHVITSTHVNLCRARRRVRSLVAVYAAFAVLVLGGGSLLTASMGAVGAGYAWLGTQTVIASLLLATSLRFLWIGRVPTPLVRALGAGPATARHLLWAVRTRAVVPSLHAELQRRHLLGADARFTMLQVSADEAVLRLADPDGPPLVVKLCRSDRARLGRHQEHANLRALAASDALGAWRATVPRPVGDGELGPLHYFVETAFDAGPVPAEEAVEAGLRAIRPLHEASAHLAVVEGELAEQLVGRPLDVLASALPHLAPVVPVLRDRLDAALAGRIVLVASVHGDLHPGNVLAGDGVGLVDWVAARSPGLPEVDALGLLVTARADRDQREVGDVLADLVFGPEDTEAADVLGDLPSAEINGDLGQATIALLTWLDHVAANLDASTSYATNTTWVARNVEVVTARLDDPRPVAPRTRRTWRWPWAVAPAVLGLLTWWLGFATIDPRSLGDLGPVGHLPAWAYLGLAILGLGFAWSVTRPRLSEGVVAGHVVALTTALYGVPVAVYGTLRYSWAWKHLGVIEFIDRTGTIDPDIATASVYHNWPGFFAAGDTLAGLTGADPVTIARWAPLAFGIASALAVAFLLSALTDDRRIVWVGTWVAVLANWVGQEYFSPQATAFVLYLVAVGLALRLRQRWSGRTGLLAAVLLVGLTAAIASSHQLTPLVLTLALGGLAVVRRRQLGALALAAATLTVGWALWVADQFVGTEIVDELRALGQPVDNAGNSLVDPDRMSEGQALVTTGGRLAVLLVLGLAAVGVLRWWRRARPRDLAALWLLLAPFSLLGLSGYGGEVLLRVVLFASPLLGFFAAWALLGAGRLRVLCLAAATAALLAGFLLAHFGKDGHYVFSPDEVAAAEFVYSNAPDGSLLIEGSRNYPKQFANYERFRYVPLEREPAATQRRIVRHPVRELADWMSDDRDEAAYLLITRSMKEELDALGVGPPRFLDQIEQALLGSDRFRVAFRNDDAVVFVLEDRR
jgi:O-antigen/teichoic acid export membrane protein